jgi:Fe-Mn family superoxide dismutase
LAPALKFNGGGHLNHSLFWQMLTPKGTSEPTGPLGDAIKRDFGSFANMVQQLSDNSLAVQGVRYIFHIFKKLSILNLSILFNLSLVGVG